MAAMGALIGGGIFDLFPRIRAAIIETAGGWVPAALDRLDTHYLMSPGPRAEPEADAARGHRRGPLFPRHRQLGALARVLRRGIGRGHVAVRAATGRTATRAWPEAVQQTVDRPRLTESARQKILGENAMRLCPRLRG